MSKTYYFPIPNLKDETLLEYEKKIIDWISKNTFERIVCDAIANCSYNLQKYLPVKEIRGSGIHYHDYGICYGYSLEQIMKTHIDVEVIYLDGMEHFVGAIE